MKKAETSRGPHWRMEDLIAFECATAHDSNEEWAVLRDRDARIGEMGDVRDHKNRRHLLYLWLKERLRQDPDIKQAANRLSQSIMLAGQLLCGAGFLIGVSAAIIALAYTGKAPINVSAFFSIFILFQLLLAIILILAVVTPKRMRELLVFGPVFSGLRWALEALFRRVHSMLSGRHRQEAAVFMGTAQRAILQHGSLSKWMAFEKIQATALFFNVGALGTLLFAVLFSDRAFGWQTTLQISGETVHFLVRLIALPWSWFYGEGLGYPDLSQIQGSRIVLKDGIQELANQDLASWWRFLAMGILFYGILPRVLFYVLGKWQLYRALGGYQFNDAVSERIVQRSIPPESGFVAQVVHQGPVNVETGFTPVNAPLVGARTDVRCLLAETLQETIDIGALRTELAQLWNLPETSVKITIYQTGSMNLPGDGLGETQQVAILYESWMPPIKEQERQLRALREALPAGTLIRLVLLGVPVEENGSVSFECENRYRQIWDTFVRQMGDPYLMLEETGA